MLGLFEKVGFGTIKFRIMFIFIEISLNEMELFNMKSNRDAAEVRSAKAIFGSDVDGTEYTFIQAIARRLELEGMAKRCREEAEAEASGYQNEADTLGKAMDPLVTELTNEHKRTHTVALDGKFVTLGFEKRRGPGGGSWQATAVPFDLEGVPGNQSTAAAAE